MERVFEKRLRKIASVDEMQFGFMPEWRTIDVVFILQRMQKSIMLKEKSCICVLRTLRKLLTEYQEKCWNGHFGRKKYQKFWLDL